MHDFSLHCETISAYLCPKHTNHLPLECLLGYCTWRSVYSQFVFDHTDTMPGARGHGASSVNGAKTINGVYGPLRKHKRDTWILTAFVEMCMRHTTSSAN